jgi:hypothetical protein
LATEPAALRTWAQMSWSATVASEIVTTCEGSLQ